jgi:hypothetical protein
MSIIETIVDILEVFTEFTDVPTTVEENGEKVKKTVKKVRILLLLLIRIISHHLFLQNVWFCRCARDGGSNVKYPLLRLLKELPVGNPLRVKAIEKRVRS